MFKPPNDPPPGTPALLQRLRIVAVFNPSAINTDTYTVSRLLADVTPTLPAGFNVKFRRFMVYFPTDATVGAEYRVVVTDLLPNNDGLVITDTGVSGQSRPSVGWTPTRIDQLETFFESNTTQNVFSWTAGSSITGSIHVVMEVEARVF